MIVNKLIGTLPGIKETRGTEPINHALFVDDSLLVGDSSLNIARAFNEVIQSFCRVS